MLNTQKYNILNIDSTTQNNTQLHSLFSELNIAFEQSTNKIDALEYLMDNSVNMLILHTSLDVEEIIEFLEIMHEDIENQETPIIIISNLDNNDTLIQSTIDFNVISIIAYPNYTYQLKNLLKLLQSHVLGSLDLEEELFQSEDRNVHDPLTDAYNRYGAEDKFHFLTSRFKAYAEPFCLVMLDIDHFKKVNDTYGHHTGDEVLISISSLLKDSIRVNDSLVRFGGEEFFIFLSNTTLKSALKIAEKFRIAIKEKIHSSKKLQITASFGVAEYEPNEDLNTLIKKADNLLYDAKASGRDSVLPLPTS
ncbi:diguanylate cyclase [Sulfurimonas aquatica]|uniref:diguanylate cyclase n=1 Tax=Sulfurimonas aquatica TaxID=2672570 RepID=A0A975AY94_9BACT|nr:GGDEF domain-containing protein [Sulfurimonas aquatica]QSZ40753.1 diguanylate cyclase [Sulfurimonas aquatica]